MMLDHVPEKSIYLLEVVVGSKVTVYKELAGILHSPHILLLAYIGEELLVVVNESQKVHDTGESNVLVS